MADKTTSSRNQQGRRTYEGRYGDAGTQPGRGFDGAQRQGVSGLPGYMRQSRPLSGPHEPRKIPEYGRNRQRLSEAVKRDQLRRPSLLPILYRKINGLFSVVVTEGYVSEVVPKHADASGDGVIEHAIDLIWEGNLLKEHAIQMNEFVGVEYDVDKNGFVVPNSCKIDVKTEEEAKTTHYTPPVGRDALGAPGTHFVALAQLVADGSRERLKIIMGGSPITHIHDTPLFHMTNGATGEELFLRYNLVLGRYETLGLKAKTPLEVNREGDDLEWKIADGSDFDLTIYTFSHDRTPQEQQVVFEIPSEEITIPSSGAHFHAYSDYITEVDYIPLTTDGGNNASPEADGAHPHTFTIPARTVSATVTIQTYKLNSSTDFKGYHWRAGVFIRETSNGNNVPPLSPPADNVPHYSRTIWVWHGEEPDTGQLTLTPL